MAHLVLNGTQIDPGFDQVCPIAVAEAVDCD
jgi:hypothetical protein